MSKWRLMIYRKNVTEPIVLHDSSETKKEDLEREIRKCFTAKDITIIETDDGVLTFRPSEISAILIQNVKEGADLHSETPEKPTSDFPPFSLHTPLGEMKDKKEEEKITDKNIDGAKT